MKYLILLLVCLAMLFSIRADAQNGYMGGTGAGEYVGGIGGGIGFGIVAGTVGSAPPPPGGCSGVVDLSAGCALPMLRGNP